MWRVAYRTMWRINRTQMTMLAIGEVILFGAFYLYVTHQIVMMQQFLQFVVR